jgi:hypothetical protein
LHINGIGDDARAVMLTEGKHLDVFGAGTAKALSC